MDGKSKKQVDMFAWMLDPTNNDDTQTLAAYIEYQTSVYQELIEEGVGARLLQFVKTGRIAMADIPLLNKCVLVALGGVMIQVLAQREFEREQAKRN